MSLTVFRLRSRFEELYTPETQQEYAQKLLWSTPLPGSDPRADVEPHVYETSTLSFHDLAVGGVNQSILVSGESGAGKTETVKICMNNIALLQQGPSTDYDEMSSVVQRIVDSNPLLETFGNAKTRRNDNSSRFGKYLQMQFRNTTDASSVGIAPKQFSGDHNALQCNLVGSKCEVYLLETNRVVHHDASAERNFHVFYQLLASDRKAEIWSGLANTTPASFRYVGENATKRIEGMDDADHFERTLSSLALVGITGEKLTHLLRAITTVMQLGNIAFDGCKDQSSIKSKDALLGFAELMGVSESTVCEALTQRTMKTRGETMKVNFGVAVAEESRDALAKAIYNATFQWLVQEINQATTAEAAPEQPPLGIIGLLDIFGFESFQTNGFEQLCINYANEKLQQKFTQDIFRQVQAEYESEGLALEDIRYEDNHELLYMIESRMGLLAILNDECLRPGGSDKEFVYKAIQQNGNASSLIVDKRFSPLEFGIRHYAGDVVYTAGSFIAKNNDTLLEDLRACAGTSTNPIIQKLAENEPLPVTPNKPGKRRSSAVAATTVWTKYKAGLANLMTDLHQTNSRYIRCIKPNELKKPAIMQHGPTLEQLRSAGVISAVNITRSAFPNWLEHASVIDRFAHISRVGKVSRKSADLRDSVEQLIGPLLSHLANGDVKAYAIGKTKTYFRAGALEHLEAERIKGFDPAAVVLQKAARGFLVRKRKHNSYIRDRNAAVTVQKTVRRFLAIRHVVAFRNNQQLASEKAAAATLINAIARGVVRRKRFRTELEKYRHVVSLKNELQRLQEEVTASDQRKVEAVESAERQVRAAMEMIQKEEEKSTSSSASIEETGRLVEERDAEIEKLRADNKRIRSTIKLLEGKYKRLREELRKKKDHNEKKTEEFLKMNEEAKAKNEENSKAVQNQTIWKKQTSALIEELKRKQTSFTSVANSRVQYQGVMADILKMLRTKCPQEQLIEDTIFIALDSDTQVKAIRASFDAIQAHQAEKEKNTQIPPTVGASQEVASASSSTATQDDEVSEIDDGSNCAESNDDIADEVLKEAEMEAEFRALAAEVGA